MERFLGFVVEADTDDVFCILGGGCEILVSGVAEYVVWLRRVG